MYLIQLVRRVVGFIHDEFIIEILPEEDVELPLSIICESMAEVVRTVPIQCEYETNQAWSKPKTQFLPIPRDLITWNEANLEKKISSI